MKNIFKLLGLALFMMLFTGCSKDSSDITLNVYNWGEYVSDGSDGTLDINAEFTKKTGIKVNYTTFQDNESLFAKLASGVSDYDVIIPSDYMVGKLIKKGMLKKLDFGNIPNFKNIKPEFINLSYDPTNEYSVPYVWGLVGLFYNKKYVCENEITWDLLWDKKYEGKILMFDNPRDAFAISQIRNGISINSTNVCDWKATAEDLKLQRPLVQSYVMDQIFDKLVGEEGYIAPYYDGDAGLIQSKNPNIGFAIPKKGTIKFVDAMCVPKNSKRPKEAEMYINFMCEEEISRANVEKIGYSSPIIDTVYIDNENLQTFSALPDYVSYELDDLWVKVKAGSSNNPVVLIIILGLFVTLYLFVLVIMNKFPRNIKNKNI